MFTKTLVPALVAVLGFGASAFAQGSGSNDVEFFHQAGAGSTEITPMLTYGNFTTKDKGATADTKSSGMGNWGMGSWGLNGTGIRAEHGLNDMLSLGAQLTFASVELDTGGATKPKISGLEDPVIYARGTTALGTGRLRWGGALDLGFQKKKFETNGDQNAASGGLALTPYVGYDMDAGPGFLGARLAYRMNFERTLEQAGTEAKTTGGDILSLSGFYEYMLSDMHLGAALNFRSVGESKTKAGATELTAKGYSPLGLGLYSRIPLTESAQLLAGFDFDFSAGGDAYDKYTGYALNVGARFGF